MCVIHVLYSTSKILIKDACYFTVQEPFNVHFYHMIRNIPKCFPVGSSQITWFRLIIYSTHCYHVTEFFVLGRTVYFVLSGGDHFQILETVVILTCLC